VNVVDGDVGGDNDNDLYLIILEKGKVLRKHIGSLHWDNNSLGCIEAIQFNSILPHRRLT